MDWQFADKGADLIGIPTPFVSSRWELGEDLRYDSAIGEQAGSQPWRNGSKPAGLVGKKLCFPVECFGYPPADAGVNRPIDESGLALCCQELLQGQGGAIVGGRGNCDPPPPFACLDLPDTLTFTLADNPSGGGGCSCLIGVTGSLDRTPPMTCRWEGTTGPVCALSMPIFFTLVMTDSTATLQAECFTGITAPISASLFQTSPFKLEFVVTQSFACCGTFDETSFKVTVE